MARAPRLRFGGFLAPHHPLGESPTLLLRRDLDLAAQLDALGYDEFWVGEHHSTGWEMIASPELFLAAAGERTGHIKLGTGVVSLPYHHPFTVAQRMVQLDHMTRGRVIFGTGPGALPSDAKMLCIEPMRQRDMQDEAIGVLIRLLEGETVTHETDWFRMADARLQILPLQERLPMATASSLSPSGMRLAGKYGIGVLSIASTSTDGLAALPTQWSIAERAAAEFGKTADRSQWRVMMSWHLAETREQARNEAVDGLLRWNNEYTVRVLGRPDAFHTDDKWGFLDRSTGTDGGPGGSIIGTPDDMIAAIHAMIERTGGFGTVIGFAHDWASPENTRRSWDLFARYVIPAFNGSLTPMFESAKWVESNKRELMQSAGAAIVAQIRREPNASEQFAITVAQRQGAGAGASAAAGAALAVASPADGASEPPVSAKL
jgi:limonene 1,2-monooxygenase